MKKLLPILLFFICILCCNKGFSQANKFPIQGFHLDLRVQVMKLEALKKFAKQLHDGGINTLVMEWEATYPFENHPLIANKYAYSREEIVDFITYCEALGIDVIPLQQSFGHVEYILRHYRYKELREDQKDYSQINPLKEELAKELFKDLYRDLISTHNSEYIHIGGDETYLLGHSKESQKKVAELGKGRLYGDYIKLLCELVVSLGKRPIVWADIAMKYPDALDGLPKETIFIDWNYGWDVNMFGKHSNLLNSGFEIWGAPALRSHPDNYFVTQWEKHFNNIKDFIPLAKDFGYNGIIMTSWSTSGLYSSLWESPKDLVELYPIRRVYPLNGFNILLEAYFESLKQDGPLDIKNFVDQYAKNQYGFNAQESNKFWNALRANPYEINQGVLSEGGIDIKTMVDSALWVKNQLHSLKPKKNKKGYAHYLLMADIRYDYLRYMDIESRLNSKSFDSSDSHQIIADLKEIVKSSKDKRFRKLHQDFLFSAEIREENSLRNSKAKLLYERLTKNSN